MEEKVILVEDKGNGIRKVILNRPEVLNAMNGAMFTGLRKAFTQIAGDDTVSVVILTGAGRAFCAGRDLKAEKDFHEGRGLLKEIHSIMESMGPPVIAAIHGYAIAGGFELALACDLIVAAEDAYFIDTHARVGVVPGAGNTQRLPRLVGEKKAKEIMFTSDRISGTEAERIGLINKAVPPGKLDEEAMVLATKIAAQPKPVIAKLKQMINEGMLMDFRSAQHYEELQNIKWRDMLDRDQFTARSKQAMKTGQDIAHK